MSYQIEWLVEKQIVQATLADELAIDELHQLIAEIEHFLQQAITPVHLIIDTRFLESFPRGVQVHYAAFKPLRRECINWFLLVGENTLLQYLTSTISHLIGVKWRAYPDKSAAIEFLKQHDTNIEWDALKILS